MSGTRLTFAIGYAQGILALAGVRILHGPRAQDWVLSLDRLYIAVMLRFPGRRDVVRGLHHPGHVPVQRRGDRMRPLDDVPLWVALLVLGLTRLGATLTRIGAWGFLRRDRVHDRLHAPTLASSSGTGGVIPGSALLASSQHRRPTLHNLMVALGITTTVPVPLMLPRRPAPGGGDSLDKTE